VTAAFDAVFAAFVLAMVAVVVLVLRSAIRRDRAARRQAGQSDPGRLHRGLPPS